LSDEHRCRSCELKAETITELNLELEDVRQKSRAARVKSEQMIEELDFEVRKVGSDLIKVTSRLLAAEDRAQNEIERTADTLGSHENLMSAYTASQGDRQRLREENQKLKVLRQKESMGIALSERLAHQRRDLLREAKRVLFRWVGGDPASHDQIVSETGKLLDEIEKELR
jgi:hypothetical protein